MNDLQILQENNAILEAAMKQPHYKKMGPEAIAFIIAKCRDIGISPLKGLNGGMCSINGKIEMTTGLMHMMIREKKHSITIDKKSDNTICILHGKRADNGDTCMSSFSIQEATAAGLTGKDVWKKYTSDMLFNRALSRLARRLFPDVIQGCYIEGEIKDTIPMVPEIKPIQEVKIEQEEKRFINETEILAFADALSKNEKFYNIFQKWCEEKQKTIQDVTLAMYNRVMQSIQNDKDNNESNNI
jgi:hypothetical protein